jgi:hypothetical protein
MKLKFKTLTLLLIVAVAIQCKKDEEQEPVINADSMFYNETQSNSGYTYFRNGKILSAASPSPHGSFKLRFNSVAQAALDSTGQLSKGSTFPENSIIVKEVYSGGSLSLLVPMKKSPNDENAANGWVWAEYDTDGSTVYSISKKGADCTGCHSLDNHRDFVKTFDLH